MFSYSFSFQGMYLQYLLKQNFEVLTKLNLTLVQLLALAYCFEEKSIYCMKRAESNRLRYLFTLKYIKPPNKIYANAIHRRTFMTLDFSYWVCRSLNAFQKTRHRTVNNPIIIKLSASIFMLSNYTEPNMTDTAHSFLWYC